MAGTDSTQDSYLTGLKESVAILIAELEEIDTTEDESGDSAKGIRSCRICSLFTSVDVDLLQLRLPCR